MTTITALDMLAPTAVGSTIWVHITGPQGGTATERPPEGTWEATIIDRQDSPPFFTLIVRATCGWTFTIAGNTETGETMLTAWCH